MRNKTFYFKKGPRAVLLFHAFSSNPNDVRSLGRALEREGYTVYAPTFAGHGTAQPEDVLNYMPADWYKDAEAAYSFLKEEGHTSIAAFGLSMGGLMAVRLLLDESLVGGGVFASPVIARLENHVPENYWRYFAELKKKSGYSSEEIKEMERQWSPNLEKILRSLQHFVEKMEPSYSSIDLPLFIGQGGQDEMIDSEGAFLFAETATKATIDLKWYDEGQHALTVGKYGVELQKDVLLFLDSLDWNGGFE